MSIFEEPKVDCHNHVFDPEIFPYQDGNPYLPAGQERGTPGEFNAVMEAYGVRYALLVEPNSGYNEDNRCMLDTIAKGNGRFKGVAVVRSDVSIESLASLKAQGIVGAAINAALYGVSAYADIANLLAKLAELDMFAQIQVEKNQLVEMAPLLRASSVKLLFDHCGRPDSLAGVGQAGFQSLLAFAESGRAFVKISGYAKCSVQRYPWPDAWPFVALLTQRFSLNHCVWGTDWPFLRVKERIDYGPLLTLVERLFPNADDRRQLMWETPCRLFNFDKSIA